MSQEMYNAYTAASIMLIRPSVVKWLLTVVPARKTESLSACTAKFCVTLKTWCRTLGHYSVQQTWGTVNNVVVETSMVSSVVILYVRDVKKSSTSGIWTLKKPYQSDPLIWGLRLCDNIKGPSITFTAALPDTLANNETVKWNTHMFRILYWQKSSNCRDGTGHFICGIKNYSTCASTNTAQKKPTYHQVTTMLDTSKNVLFPGHNHLLTTGADDPILAGAWVIIKVSGHQYQWLAGGYDLKIRTFFEVASTVVIWWIVFFLHSVNCCDCENKLQTVCTEITF